MKSREARRVVLLGFTSIGLMAAGIGLSGCGEAEPPPPPAKPAAPAPVDASSKKGKGKKEVDTMSRQELHKKRAAEKAGG